MLEANRSARDRWLAQRIDRLSPAEVATLRAAAAVLEKLQATAP
jgi:hypothetical protein